jgi:hypothetical protein
MASPDHSAYQRGIINRYYEHIDTIALQKLGEVVSDLYLAEGSKATKLWTSARAALMKLTAPDDPRVANVLSTRSVTALAKLLNDLNTMARTAPPTAPKSASASPVALDPDQLKQAMKAFRKRLKLTILDEESKLGRTGNPMSGGKLSKIVAIMAPREYPAAVWEELARQGKLKSSGGSFYELVGD